MTRNEIVKRLMKVGASQYTAEYAAVMLAEAGLMVIEKVPGEAEIERVARAHYNKYFEGVGDLEPKWRGTEAGEPYWYRMFEAARAAAAAVRDVK